MMKFVLVAVACIVVTNTRNLEALSIKRAKSRTKISGNKNMADFYEKLSNMPGSDSLNDKIDNIQAALVILHDYLDNVKDSSDAGPNNNKNDNDVDESALQNVVNDIYRQLKNLYTNVENVGNSRVYNSLSSLYEMLSWKYGEDFAALVREELPLDDDLQIDPGQTEKNGQSQSKNQNPIISQLSDMDLMLQDINKNTKVMLTEDERNADFVNAMTRALHRTYSEESNREMESQTSPETESRDEPTTTPESESSNEGDGQTTTPEATSTKTLMTTDAPTTTEGDSQLERRMKDNDRKLEELLIKEILKKRIENNL